MAPRGREGKESAWVKKTPAGAAPDKAKEPENGEEREGAAKGRDGGKGKGRKGDRPRREARDREEDGAAADGKGKGRGKGKHKKGSSEAEGRDSNSGEEEAEDASGALLKMLKANPPKVTRYTKGELLSIARLPASNVKPPDLDPIVDKDNKDSVLLTRIATGREKHEEDNAGAEGEEGGGRRRSKVGREGEAEGAAPAPAPAEAVEPGAPAAEEEEDGEGKARAFEKWFGRNMPKLEAAGKATPSSGPSSQLLQTEPVSCLGDGAGKAGSTASPTAQALLQQQALAAASNTAMNRNLLEGGQAAHAMQAAAYMQAMTQMQVAAAAARQSSYAAGQMPWNSYNAYMNPYMNAYGSGYGSLDPYAALQQQQTAAANLSEAMQAKLAGQLNQLASSQAARNMATVVKAAAQAKLQAAKAVPKAPGPAKASAKAAVPPKSTPAPKPQASPKQRPAAPSAAGLLPAKKSAPSAPEAPPKADAPAVPKSAPAEGGEEDEAGCSQS